MADMLMHGAAAAGLNEAITRLRGSGAHIEAHARLLRAMQRNTRRISAEGRNFRRHDFCIVF